MPTDAERAAARAAATDIPDVKTVREAIFKCVRSFHKSSIATERLLNEQKQRGLNARVLPLPAITRWAATYLVAKVRSPLGYIIDRH